MGSMLLQVKLRKNLFPHRSGGSRFMFWQRPKTGALFSLSSVGALLHLLWKWQGSSDDTILISGWMVGWADHCTQEEKLMHQYSGLLAPTQAALQKRTWEFLWISIWTWARNVTLEQNVLMVSWAVLGGLLPVGRGKSSFSSTQH